MTTYHINAEMLGSDATDNDARRMVTLLKAKGYNVEFGEPVRQPEAPFDDAQWQHCLDLISFNEQYVGPIINDGAGDWKFDPNDKPNMALFDEE